MDEKCKSFIAPVKNLVLFLQEQGEDRSLLLHAQLVILPTRHKALNAAEVCPRHLEQ